MECWAKTMGECSGISKEHLISQSTFQEDNDYRLGMIKCYGLPWSENKMTEMSFNSLCAKILCKKHNNMLSILDEEAGRVAKTFSEIKNIYSKKSARSNDKIIEFRHFGDLLERWFLKTFINFQQLYNKSEVPPRELVEIVFGFKKYPDGVGLSVFGHNGGYFHSFDHDMKYVQILNKSGSSNAIEFIVFEYFGINYLLPLTDLPLTDQLLPKNIMNLEHVLSGHDPIDKYISAIQGASILYHPKGINFNIGTHQKIKVNFSW